jgi:hypothetical protein
MAAAGLGQAGATVAILAFDTEKASDIVDAIARFWWSGYRVSLRCHRSSVTTRCRR